DPTLAIAPQVAQSIYFALPKLAEKLGGFSETVYRLPSALLLGMALFFIARLAARLIHPRAAWFAVFACLAMHGFNYQAADARPYALGTAVAAASVWFLVRWLDSARWRYALLFAASAALLLRVQLVYWPFYFLLSFYATVRLVKRETAVKTLHAAGIYALLGLSLVPLLPGALVLLGQAQAHVLVGLPSALDVFHSLTPETLVICAGGTGLLAGMLRWRLPEDRPRWRSAALLILGWWLCQPLGLFAFSWITGHSVFVPRYLSLSLPGAALTATALASRYIPANRWHAMAALLGVGVFLCMGHWNVVWPQHDGYNWRAAAQAIDQQTSGPRTPVICISPFIEARSPAWYPGYPPDGFLYAHLQAYPIAGKPYLFPFIVTPQAEQFAATVSKNALVSSRRFFVYGMTGRVYFWREWLRNRPELGGWTSRRIGPSGYASVVEFTAAATR
ncbi:MAG: glycosyltransferase family 39 protein, partial [Bryobacteraceae bacterium]